MLSVPELRAVYSKIYRCHRCKTWFARLPKWAGLDKGDQCTKCGCTSFTVTNGRPWGTSSERWPRLVQEFGGVYRSGFFWDGEDDDSRLTEYVTVEPRRDGKENDG